MAFTVDGNGQKLLRTIYRQYRKPVLKAVLMIIGLYVFLNFLAKATFLWPTIYSSPSYRKEPHPLPEGYLERWSKLYLGEDLCNEPTIPTPDEDERIIPPNVLLTPEDKKALQFRADGTFKITIFTDLHFECGTKCGRDINTLRIMETVLEQERPDFVIYTGDVFYFDATTAKSEESIAGRKAAMLDAFSPVVSRKIPFATIFGNHDDESQVESKFTMLQQQYRCPGSLTRKRDPSATIPQPAIRDDKHTFFSHDFHLCIRPSATSVKEASPTAHGAAAMTPTSGAGASFIFLDSGYDHLTEQQVLWTRNLLSLPSSELCGFENPRRPLMDAVFVHIPVPQFSKVCSKGGCLGTWGERVIQQDKDTGLHEVMRTVSRADVRAIFSGHDHLNSFAGVLDGVSLLYNRASGLGGYGRDWFSHGARTVLLNERTGEVSTWMLLEDGRREDYQIFDKQRTKASGGVFPPTLSPSTTTAAASSAFSSNASS